MNTERRLMIAGKIEEEQRIAYALRVTALVEDDAALIAEIDYPASWLGYSLDVETRRADAMRDYRREVLRRARGADDA